MVTTKFETVAEHQRALTLDAEKTTRKQAKKLAGKTTWLIQAPTKGIGRDEIHIDPIPFPDETGEIKILETGKVVLFEGAGVTDNGHWALWIQDYYGREGYTVTKVSPNAKVTNMQSEIARVKEIVATNQAAAAANEPGLDIDDDDEDEGDDEDEEGPTIQK